MARTKRWIAASAGPSITIVRLSSWQYFDDFIRQQLLERNSYIWRGQPNADWFLEPTLDRLLKRRGLLNHPTVRLEHLRRFQYSSRGRRGPYPRLIENENDWWALGQHYGLATPLLDWTTSPFVAAYFAFAPEDNDGADQRALYALFKRTVEEKSSTVMNEWKDQGRPPIVEFIEPLSDENNRLVSQGALFTRAPDGVLLEQWIAYMFPEDEKSHLMKIVMPSKDRVLALRSLNRMNINHLSLFPDLEGATKFANLHLVIDRY
jgi:FRG domain-containing protein